MDPDYIWWLKIHHPGAVGSGTAASRGALDSGTITSGGGLGGGTVTSGGAAVNGGAVSSGASSGPMSGGACHSGEPLVDDWPFPDNFTSEQLELFNAWLSEGYDQFVDTDYYSYICWLEQYHPEALPPDCYTLYQTSHTTHSS